VKAAVEKSIVETKAIINCIVVGARLDHPANQAVDDIVLVEGVLSTLRIERAEFRRDALGTYGNEVVHLIFMDNPMPPHMIREWEGALSQLIVRTLQGVGVARKPVTCTYCLSRTHPFFDCPIRARHGWFDTEALAGEAAPGQNIAPAPIQHPASTSNTNGGRGRGRPFAAPLPLPRPRQR
jgi:hypothetical protein